MTTQSSYTVSGVITNVGIQAAIAAGTAGPLINITGFVVGSLDATSGAVALPTDTAVASVVYTGTAAQMQYLIVDTDTCMFRIELDTTVGNFSVGTIGLMLAGNVLFAEAVMPGPSVKYATSPPTTVGNIKFYNVIVRLANVADLINLTIIESLDAALPEVATELLLPAASSSPFPAYMVDNHTHYGVPTVALRLNGQWFHALHHTSAGQGISVISTTPSQFDTPVPALSCVYIGNSGLFEIADGANTAKYPIGFRTSSFEVTCEGMVAAAQVGLTAPLTPGQLYYCGTGGTVGLLTTSVVGEPVAYAVSVNDVYVSMSDNFGGGAGIAATVILYHSGVDTGTANSYILNTTNPTVTSLANGTKICFTALHAPSTTSPAPSTLTVGSFGPYPLLRDDGLNPLPTDMQGSVDATYFNSNWYIPVGAINLVPTPATPSLPCHGVDIGTIYNFHCTQTYPTCTQIVPGTTCMFTCAHPPDGQQQCSIRVEGFGPYNCNRDDGNNLNSYDCAGVMTAVYDGNNFVCKRGVYPQTVNIPTVLVCTGIDTGTDSVHYNCATPNPNITQCIQGTTCIFQPAHPPTGGACFLTCGAFGPFPLLRADLANPLAQDMQSICTCVFDGSRWIINASKPGRLISSTTYTSSATYTASAGMTYCHIRMGGGGAGGGGCNVPNVGYCGLNAPGCAGAYGECIYTSSDIGTSQPIICGAGGLGGPTSSTPCTNGGATSFGGLASCPGGVAVNNYVNSPAPCKSECTITTATPTGCNLVATPGCGGDPCIAYSSSVVSPGHGGDHQLGCGGRGIDNGTPNASPGGNCSGGGSGSVYSNHGSPCAGQNGGGGFVHVEEYGY